MTINSKRVSLFKGFGLALILVLGSLAWGAPKIKPTKVLKSTPELVAQGKASFTTNCVLCHGEKGDGNGPAGAMMNPKPRNLADVKTYKNGATPEKMFDTVSNGLKNTSMAGFPHLPEEERWALVHFVKSEFHKK